jgi:hypothetical protein
MLVKELIEKLKNLPENYTIVMESGMDVAEIDIHQLDEFSEVVLVPLG